MIYEILHTTRYDYDEAVTASYAELHMLPSDMDGQVCLRRSVTSSPAAGHYRERTDYFGNLAAVLTIHEPHTRLDVTSSSVIDTAGRPTGIGAAARRSWESVVSETGSELSVADLVLDSPLVARSEQLATYAGPSFGAGRSVGDAVVELTSRIHTDFVFDTEATDVETPLEEVMEMRKGVCQDFAHVLVGSLRSIGIAACYVSGYLETVPPPGKERLVGVDRTHAWVLAYLGEDKWLGFDPTNDQIAGPRYVTTAHGRDYDDVPPLRGVIFTDATESLLTVEVDVAPRSDGLQ